jgi:hypothetical protein
MTDQIVNQQFDESAILGGKRHEPGEIGDFHYLTDKEPWLIEQGVISDVFTTTSTPYASIDLPSSEPEGEA